MSSGIVLAAVLAVAVVVAVALPFLREPDATLAEDRLGGASPLERERVRLAEERDHALAALSELEFDHRTGKVSDDDYRAQIGPLRRAAAAALRALDAAQPPSSANGTGATVGKEPAKTPVPVQSGRRTG